MVMNAWLLQVYETIQHHQLLDEGDTVLVALSGGADSMALLAAMCALKEPLGLQSVCAAHLHHGLRGATADRDEAFVHSVCQTLGIPIYVSHVDTVSEAQRNKESVEEAARRLRYHFLESTADSLLTPVKIAVAHNADDQAETILFHMARGTGMKGLRGMPIRRGRVIRPLLYCSSASVRDYCREQNLSYMIDETNADVYYARNRIRHRIIPELNQINSGVVSHLCRLADIAAQEDAFLDNLALQCRQKATLAHGYDAAVLRQTSPVIAKRVLMQIVSEECRCSADFSQIEELWERILHGGQFGGLPDRTIAQCSHDVLTFHNAHTMPEAESTTIPLQIGNTASFHGETFRVMELSYQDFLEKSKIHKNFLHYCISYDMITNSVCMRSRTEGDRLCLHKKSGTKPLKKLFNEWRIPVALRSSVPVICDGSRVIMVLGYGVDEAYTVHSHTQTIWYLERL